MLQFYNFDDVQVPKVQYSTLHRIFFRNLQTSIVFFFRDKGVSEETHVELSLVLKIPFYLLGPAQMNLHVAPCPDAVSNCGLSQATQQEIISRQSEALGLST